MRKKIFLTSALLVGFIAPAFADDTIATTGDYITGGAGTCNIDILGVSDDGATANTVALWSLNSYECAAGQYLDETTLECTTCPTGSYCPGGTYTIESENKGTTTCPTGYANSDAGASADTQCYTACTVETANIAHATAVSGNDYFGTGTDTCGATACIAGWHVKPGLDIGATIGEEAGSDSTYINNDGSFYGIKGQEYYGISGKNSFAVDYEGKGILTGHGRCSTQAGVGMWDGASTPEDVTVVNSLTDETGQSGAKYCYCQVDGFTPTGGTKAIVTSAPWVFLYGVSSADSCTDRCASYCAHHLRFDAVNNLAFRAAVMNGLPVSSATCAANTINIDWNPDNNGEHTINQCTYEGAIEVPEDPVKPGYTFTGWKLVDETATTTTE